MSDIFTDDSDFLGAGDDPFQSAEAAPVDAGVVDSGSADAAEQASSTDEGATAPDQGDTGTGTQQQPDASAQAGTEEQQPSETDLARMEQEADAALADERTPKWYKNAVERVYKPKLEQLGKDLEAYSAFGPAAELQGKLDLLSGLNEIRRDPNTGMPVQTSEKFVKGLYEQDPDTAYRLMNELANVPAPDGSGQTMIQALFNQMGIDPNRLSDIQQFAQNGYQLQASQYEAPDPADLAMIPQHLQATFAKLDPDTRDSLMSDHENVRNRNLEAHKFQIETQERQQAEAAAKEQNEAKQLAEQQAQFRQQVEAKGEENFSKASEGVLKSFVDSLAKQAGMSQLDSLMIANTVLNAFEPTLAGQMSLAALKEAGIEIDSSVQQTIAQLEESAGFAAYHELVGDTAALQREVARQTELQQRLTAKGNKIIAALAVKRNGSLTAPQKQVNAQLAATANSIRHAVTGSPAGGSSLGPRPGGQQMDFSDESYLEDLQRTGFGRP